MQDNELLTRRNLQKDFEMPREHPVRTGWRIDRRSGSRTEAVPAIQCTGGTADVGARTAFLQIPQYQKAPEERKEGVKIDTIAKVWFSLHITS